MNKLMAKEVDGGIELSGGKFYLPVLLSKQKSETKIPFGSKVKMADVERAYLLILEKMDIKQAYAPPAPGDLERWPNFETLVDALTAQGAEVDLNLIDSLSLGDWVVAAKIYKRKEIWTGKYERQSKVWVQAPAWGIGLYLGPRTITDGRTHVWGEGENEWKPYSYLRAALVCFDAHKNPLYVPLTALSLSKIHNAGLK